MDKEIHKAFYDGIHEVYSTVFTDGKNDGIKLYLLCNDIIPNIYGEKKVKKYKKPVLLVAKAVSSVQPSGSEVERVVKNTITFTVPFKSLNENGILCQTEDDWDYLSRGYIEFHNSFYEVKKASPNTFIEDSFMTVVFEAEYRKDIKGLLIEEEQEGG